MSKIRRGGTDRAKSWGRLVVAWEKSGLTQAEFCRRRGVKAVTFSWWKGKLNATTNPGRRRRGRRSEGYQAGDHVARGQQGYASFVEVALPGVVSALPSTTPVAASTAGYEVVLPGGFLIRLPGDFDPDKASRLLRAVASTC